MDTFPKLKHLVFFFFLFFPSFAISQSAPTGYVDLGGWVKGVDGTYSKAFEGATRTSPLAGTLKIMGDTPVHTSKGAFTIPVEKTANVDVPRIGKVVRGLATGPVGLTITAASLVCDLTSICSQAGQWLFNTVDFGGIGAGNYPTCQEAIGLSAGANWTDCTNINNAHPSAVWFRTPKSPPANANCINRGSAAWTYTAFAYTCSNPPTTTRPAIEADWDAKQSSLNDSRFVTELITKLADIPTGLPTITNTPKKTISEDTTLTKDQNGNVTGTKVTTTEAEIVDAATAESPGQAIVKEKTTVNNYDINNALTSSTTSTSYTNQPPPNNPADQITISFDDVPDTGIEQQDIDADLETPESWGDGFCPADESISYHYGTLTFDFQPTCDFATEVKPVLLFIASITAMFIISGVRVE